MSNIVLHPQTSKQLQAFTDKPSHALLLIGPMGSGKLSVAKIIAETTLDIPTVTDHPYSLHIVPDGTSIGIEAIRRIEQFLSLKVPGKRLYRRAIIIEQAQRLSTEAQNALLKNLEEPPADTIIILTATHASGLLPTIRSRAQTIIVNQPDREALSKQFPATDPPAYNRAYAL
jgi:DNA polymerase III gamma/tau subunit